MNNEETQTLWHQGKSAWAEWANRVADKKKTLESAGQWSADWFGEGQNAETKAWLEEAATDFTSVEFPAGADFSGMHFPGPADFDEARFDGAANFAETRFAGNVSFERARLTAAADLTGAKFLGFTTFDDTHFADVNFAAAEFLRENRDLLAPAVRFHRVQFQSRAAFSGVRFAGAVEFLKAVFTGDALFDAAECHGGAMFKAARFGAAASFTKARFAGTRIDFCKAQFCGAACFAGTHFGGSGGELMISGAGAVNFEAAHFEDEAAFQQAWFVGESEFKTAQFDRPATFAAASFVMPASFGGARFSGSASFKDAHFVRDADFSEVRFAGQCDFSDASIGGEASFAGARFDGPADFSRAGFADGANFHAATGDGTIALDGTQCAVAPDFSEASLKEPPALDKLVLSKPEQFQRGGRQHVIRPMLMRWFRAAPRPDMAAHYRRLRDLVSREAPVSAPESNVIELWPAGTTATGTETPEPAAAGPAPKTPVRRLMVRPFLAWAASIAGFAAFYIRQRPDSGAAGGVPWHLPGWPAPLAWDWAPDWLNTVTSWIWVRLDAALATVLEMFSTGPCLQGSSNPVGEAFYLSLRNATLLSGAENGQVAQRVYGCLYGLDGTAPVLPLAVSLGSTIQTLLSAVLIFLFFLALVRRLTRK